MFIGKIGIQNYNPISSLIQSVNRSYSQQTGNSTRKSITAKNIDTVDISGSSDVSEKNIGIYTRNHSQMHSIFPNEISYTKAEKDPRLQAELLPPSEKEYTEQDALMNQYQKQGRINGHMENGEFVVDGDVKLFPPPDMVSKEELEAFRQKLVQDGLGDEIDWKGVSHDFIQIGVGFNNVQKLEDKVDYLTSRYAVLKDRIQTQYTGDEKEKQMNILNDIYSTAKEKIADTYATTIGGFYEDLGQNGIAEAMKNSLLTAIDQRASEYETHLAGAGDYARISNEENQWLLQDDGFMAAQLRQSMSAVEQNTENISENSTYSLDDLKFAGVYAKALNKQLDTTASTWYNSTDDNALGTDLASQYKAMQNTFTHLNVSDKMFNLVNDTFEPFMDKLMDKIDKQIDKQKDFVTSKGNGWMTGLVRTNHINRNAVYKAFHTAIGK